MEISRLTDFHPLETGLLEPVEGILADFPPRDRAPCGREAFLARLAGVPALRRTPGIPGPGEPGFWSALPRCPGPEEAAACRDHLKRVYGVTDRESLLEFCGRELRCQPCYLDFEALWEGRPRFDPGELAPKARERFERLRDFAAQFYPLLGRSGFLGWDISECVGLLRAARACGILSLDEFSELAEYWVQEAQTFRSWTHFAVSLVCGELFWDLLHGASLEDAAANQGLWVGLARRLLEDDEAWGGGWWYAPVREKDFAIPAPDIRPLLEEWEGPRGCIATDRVVVEGRRVGYCYREEPDQGFPDSGWRFFAGDEDEEYLSDPGRSGAYDLNTLVNYDPEILPLLKAPFGTAFARGEDGAFVQEPLVPPDGESH